MSCKTGQGTNVPNKLNCFYNYCLFFFFFLNLHEPTTSKTISSSLFNYTKVLKYGYLIFVQLYNNEKIIDLTDHNLFFNKNAWNFSNRSNSLGIKKGHLIYVWCLTKLCTWYSTIYPHYFYYFFAKLHLASLTLYFDDLRVMNHPPKLKNGNLSR